MWDIAASAFPVRSQLPFELIEIGSFMLVDQTCGARPASAAIPMHV
jgi:hypothetical protein